MRFALIVSLLILGLTSSIRAYADNLTIAIPIAPEVAPSLFEISLNEVGSEGEILKQTDKNVYLVGIPTTIQTGSVCVRFVGQKTVTYHRAMRTNDLSLPTTTYIKAIAARDPVNNVCIMIYPPPVETFLSIEVRVSDLDEGSQNVGLRVGGKIQHYKVSLDTTSEKVSIEPVE